MKIDRCTTAVVEANYDYTFVRIFADTGVYGTGECFFAPGLTASLHEMFGLLIGRDPRQVDRLARHLWRKGSGAGAVAGYLYNAVSGIEAALWDLVAKDAGLPIYQFLGGKMRDDVRVYVDCHAGDNLESWSPMLEHRRPRWLREAERGERAQRYEPQQYKQRAQQMVEAGFDALKFDIDSIVLATGDELNRPLSNGEMRWMRDCVAAAREGAGDDADLAVDCHWRFSPAQAVRITRELDPFNLCWLEDPCPPENWRGVAQVRAAGCCPVLTGENLNRRTGFWDLIANHAVDLVAPDMQKCGGLLEAKRIAELAETQGISVAPHNIASPLGTLAAAHVCATIPNFVALEFHGSDVPFWDDLLTRSDGGGPLIEKGRIRLTEAPGVGGELNEQTARQYAKQGEPFFER